MVNRRVCVWAPVIRRNKVGTADPLFIPVQRRRFLCFSHRNCLNNYRTGRQGIGKWSTIRNDRVGRRDLEWTNRTGRQKRNRPLHGVHRDNRARESNRKSQRQAASGEDSVPCITAAKKLCLCVTDTLRTSRPQVKDRCIGNRKLG